MASTQTQIQQQLQSRFLSLPAELVIEIVSHLSEDRNALCSLARTCRRLQPLCEEHIYAVIELFSTDDLHDILEAFSRRFERIGAVNTLKILYKYDERLGTTLDERKALNDCVREMKGLKDWHVESPYDNFHWQYGGEDWVENDMVEFHSTLEKVSYSLGQPLQADFGLAKLNKLILHSHGATSDFWDLNKFHCLFRHPSLRYLHVSCVNLPVELPELEPFASTTPLTTLIFDECEIEPGSLRSILGTPKSLKHLTLGENVYNIHHSRGVTPRLSKAPDAALQALLPVAHSLESLTHYDPMFMSFPDPDRPLPLRLKGDGMRHFHRLSFLECDPCSFLHRGIILASTLAPPNLETLRIRHPRRQEGNYFDQLPDFTPYTSLGSVKTVEFVQSTSVKSPLQISEFICEVERLRERHATAYKLHQHGINMRVLIEIHESGSLIPPYLHGEPTPRLVCLYDAEEVGFIRKIVEDESESQASPTGFTIRERLFSLLRNRQNRENEDAGSAASASANTTPAEEEGPTETDQLGAHDILRLKNEVRRAIFNETQIDDTMAQQRRTALQLFVSANAMDETDDSETDEEDEDDDFMDAEDGYEVFLVDDGDEIDETEDDGDVDIDELD